MERMNEINKRMKFVSNGHNGLNSDNIKSFFNLLIKSNDSQLIKMRQEINNELNNRILLSVKDINKGMGIKEWNKKE